jgi:4-hydroxy-4-methyl-2-oxoglutarate aldolase
VQVLPSRRELVSLTASWLGDRSDDGRPRVPDHTLAHLRLATHEQAWSVLSAAGYERQYAGGWRQTRPSGTMLGRAVTAQFVPYRPDLDAAVVAAGARVGHVAGDRQNSWVVDTLQEGDVMVVDIFGKVRDGTVIGDNLGAAVASRTRAGAVIHGGVRDLQGLMALSDMNVYFRETDPTPIRNVTLVGINVPIRVGECTVMPGDVVLGTLGGVTFIPPVLAGPVADSAEVLRLRDEFAKMRLVDRVYTSAEIDTSVWPDHIEADYERWRHDGGHR